MSKRFEDRLRAAAKEDRLVGYEATPAEAEALADAVQALRKIARPGDRTTDVAQVIAQDALARLDATSEKTPD